MNSLGIDKSPQETRVVVAMSGGVDSSTCAAMLAIEGYDVVGLTLKLHDKRRSDVPGSDIYDAKKVAQKYGFDHHVLDLKNEFKTQIIDEFVDQYSKGLTPVPCATCNQKIKFGEMLNAALDMNADCLVTGHYVQIKRTNGGNVEIHGGKYQAKDQSYFLFALKPHQLEQLRFPLGSWTKAQTREKAQELGLFLAKKAESQDICFVPEGDYAKVVSALGGDKVNKQGDIVHLDGRVLGHHSGVINYTIGQRKGLRIGGGHSDDGGAFYVVDIKAKENKVIVGSKDDLARTVIELRDCNWMCADISNGEPHKVGLKFRSSMKTVCGVLTAKDDGTATIKLESAQYGISPGQAGVCYDGTRLVGGGTIKSSFYSPSS